MEKGKRLKTYNMKILQPEDVLKKAIELIENGTFKENGLKARGSVVKYKWDDIVDEFEGIVEELI